MTQTAHSSQILPKLQRECKNGPTALPGVTRGGHYHHTKTEKFLIVHGEALFRFRHVITGEVSANTDETIKLIIRTANNKHADFELELSPSATIYELKRKITVNHPTKPVGCL